MKNFHLPRRIANIGFAVLVGGCALGNPTFADQKTPNVATFSSPLSYQMYNILAAEMYARNGNPAQASLHYLAAAEQGEDPTLAQRAAELAINARDNQLASRALERWIKLDPASTEAMQYRVLSDLRAGRFEQASKGLVAVRNDVEKREGHGFEFIISLLALEPDTASAYETFKYYVEREDSSARAQLVLASLALGAARFDAVLKAGEAAKKAGDKEQKEQASRFIAKAFMGMEKFDDAVKELGPVAKDSKNPDLKLDYARMLVLADRRFEATPLYKQLYASQPDNTDILYTLGLLYLEQKEFAFAEPLIKKLLNVPGRATEANYFMGQIYEGQKRSREAIEAYKNAVQGSFGLEATGRIANLMLETDGLEPALKWLGEQEKAAPSDVRKLELLLVAGQLLHDKEKYQEAVASYDKAIALKADDFDALYSRSLSLDRLGRFDAAEKDLRTLIELQPDNPTVLNALGYMLVVNTERYADARKLLSKAVELRPNDAAIMDSMGWLEFRSGNPGKAEDWLRKSYNQLKDPEVASHLVEVLSALGKTAEAKTILQDMLAKFPNDELLMKVKEKLVGL